jgi:DNA-binding transcriptional LysR family regulator
MPRIRASAHASNFLTVRHYMNTLQNMPIFVRVVDTGSFTAASASLDVSLGTASRAVSELENHLRTRLLHRSTRRISPTPEGLPYADRCRRILADMVRAKDDTARAAGHPSGLLRVHRFASLGHRHVMPAIKANRAQFPDVQVELCLTQTMLNVFDGTCDLPAPGALKVQTACRLRVRSTAW